MTILQRLILVAGVLAALAVTFIWPPKYLQAMNGAKLSIEGECGPKYEARDPAVAEFEKMFPDFKEPPRKLRDGYLSCAAQATVNVGLLSAYLGVISVSTGVLFYATRPRIVPETRRTTDESAPQ